MAEQLYGYSSEEALDNHALDLIVDPEDHSVANEILHRVAMGERWTGQFPVKNKSGNRFSIVATNTPLYDDNGVFVGVISVCTDSRPFEEGKALMSVQRDCWENCSSFSRPRGTASTKLCLDPPQPLQVAIASKISNLVSILPLVFSVILSVICIAYIMGIY